MTKDDKPSKGSKNSISLIDKIRGINKIDLAKWIITVVLFGFIVSFGASWAYDHVPKEWHNNNDEQEKLKHINSLIEDARDELNNKSYRNAIDKGIAAQKASEDLFRNDIPIELYKINGTIRLILGDAYLNLSNSENKKENLNKAIGNYKSALEVWTFNETRENYAQTQNSLGRAYYYLSKIQDMKENSINAIAAYNETLKVWELRNNPEKYYQMQNNLGDCYCLLSRVEDKERNLKRAIVFHENALKFFEKNNLSLDYATTRNDLGLDYRYLSEVRNKKENLNKSIDNHTESLHAREVDDIYTYDAQSQNDLGAAYMYLLDIEHDEKKFGKAFDCFNRALKNVTDPTQKAEIENNIGVANYIISKYKNNYESLNASIDAYNEALSKRTKEDYPIDYAETENNIAVTYTSLSGAVDEKNKKMYMLYNAFYHFCESLKTRCNESSLYCAETKHNQAVAYISLFKVTNNVMYLEKARDIFLEILKIRTCQDYPLDYADSINCLGDVYLYISDFKDSDVNRDNAIRCFSDSIKLFAKEDPIRSDQIQSKLNYLQSGRNANLAAGPAEVANPSTSVPRMSSSSNEHNYDCVPFEYVLLPENSA